ncbi:MAG: PDZ domain-containing protein [Kofleriaceae bacterium]|nr:PDZ domain-containing protein [Kofleriaceae bacterium]
MRTSNLLAVAFVSVLLGGIATAKPVSKPVPSAPSHDIDTDSMSITMTSSKGRLGVAVVEISPELRSHFGAPADRGVLVNVVKADSPAAKAGLRVGDVVTEVDGQPATSAMDMLEAMSDRKKGEAVSLAVLRAGKRTELTATLTEDPGMTWHRATSSSFPRAFQMDPRFKQWFDASGMSQMDAFMNPGGGDSAMQQRIDELERRLNALEKKRFH